MVGERQVMQGTNPATNFLGTTDNQPLQVRLNNGFAGQFNGANRTYTIGLNAGAALTTGTAIVAIGSGAMRSATDRNYSVAIGDSALQMNGVGASGGSEGNFNVAIGSHSMYSNTRGFSNTAIGSRALNSNTTGNSNTATGTSALSQNRYRKWKYCKWFLFPVCQQHGD
jgi:hypothetical protein